jgi:hypothetical protein
MSSAPNIARRWWQVGMRVVRMSSENLGTIVEVNGPIKVKWDNGQTSYFTRGRPSDVRLKLLAPTG